jgi:hypothetical protein
MTTRVETLRALKSRIRECKGADRDLDALIYAWRHNAVSLGYSSIDHGWMFEYPAGRDCIDNADLTHFTTYPDGLGACVSLMESALPGWKWIKGIAGHFYVHTDTEIYNSDRALANDCLTFIDAIISASIAELEAQLNKENTHEIDHSSL